MKIKTIKARLDDAEDFDAAVNKALEDGWRLTRREIIVPQAQTESFYIHPMLYAELVQMYEPEVIDPIEALRIVRDTCQSVQVCGQDCPIFDWCDASVPDGSAPTYWKVPGDGEAEK